ncbi:hypothetical protein EB077_08715 [bacterium]|nr:hypothetical protein [bacterium]
MYNNISMRINTTKRDQNGLAAIIVATIIMIILSLIALGFGRIMRREQRQSLDRSLSTQAFYAAESAVNEAVKLIQSETNPYTANKTSCGADATFTTGTIDSNLLSSYTCLLIDQSPPTLEYTQGSISTNSSKTIPVRGKNNETIGRLSVSWEDPTLSTTTTGLSSTPVFSCPSPVALPKFTSWNSKTPGMIRLDIIPADTLDRASLQTKTASFYLYPADKNCGSAVSSTTYSGHIGDTNKGQLVLVKCDPAVTTRRDCELSINMDGSYSNKLYYIRVRSVYRSSDMTVKIFDTASTPNQLNISGAQVQIDSTGKVNDVLRRIQVRVPVSKSYAIPDYAIQTTDKICKLLQIVPDPINTVDDGCTP